MKYSMKLVLLLTFGIPFNGVYADETTDLKVKVCEQQNTINSLQAQMAEYMAHFDTLVKSLHEMQSKYQIANTNVSTVAAPLATAVIAPAPVLAPIYYSYYDVNREKIFTPQPSNNYYFQETIPHFYDYFALNKQPTLLPLSQPNTFEATRFNFENPSMIINANTQGFNFGTASHL